MPMTKPTLVNRMEKGATESVSLLKDSYLTNQEQQQLPEREPQLQQSSRFLSNKKQASASATLDPIDVLQELNIPMSSTETVEPSSTVHFVWSTATVLSGRLTACKDRNDETCRGGLATVQALGRIHSKSDPLLIIPKLDYQSAFVQMHPLSWSVNRLAWDRWDWHTYFCSPWLFFDASLQENAELLRDASPTRPLRPVLSNLAASVEDAVIEDHVIDSSNSTTSSTIETIYDENGGTDWLPYVDAIHWDEATRLAVMTVDQADQPGITTSTPRTIAGLLEYVNARNRAAGCAGAVTAFQNYLLQQRGQLMKTVNEIKDDPHRHGLCWTPILVYEDRSGSEPLITFLEQLAALPNPPALVIDVKKNVEGWETPRQYSFGKSNSNMWITSYDLDRDEHVQHKLTLDTSTGSLINVEQTVINIEEIPEEVRRDDEWAEDILWVHSLGQAAAINDPIVGTSGEMPLIRIDDWRHCMGGECPGANLFSDALRWSAEADVAFLGSGGLRGVGWPAGKVKTSHLFDMLPFPNTACVGRMTGLSLFRLLDTSMRYATFESTYTAMGDRLLQVSGMRYVYNTELPADGTSSRLISVDVWSDITQTFEPLQRLKLYTFVTDSWMCSGFDPFPPMVTTDLVLKGEEQGTIRSVLHQQIVAQYLNQLNGEYDTNIQGRLSNNTNISTPLDFIQSQTDCTSGTHWVDSLQTCISCPETDKVQFTKSRVEFEGNSGSAEIHIGNAEIINGEDFPVSVRLKSHPSWIDFTGVAPTISRRLEPGAVSSWEFQAQSNTLEAGTAASSVSFQIQLVGSDFPSCIGNDASVEVFMRVAPQAQLSKPGTIRATGLSFMGIAACTAIFFGTWVIRHSEKRIVKAMQPRFLSAICIGVCAIALSIIPLSVADDIPSQRGRDMSCMAIPWMLSLGFTIAILSLFAKLWRINQVFNGQQFRRVTVSSSKVTMFCGGLTAANFLLLIVWTITDPLHWVVRFVKDEPWNQYGACTHGAAGNALLGLTIAFNLTVLSIACYQAYKAKNISDEYSESKHLGIALFGWVEIVLVGFPVMFLIEGDNSNARYFLQVILITCICMSMLLIIFIPIMIQFYSNKRETSRTASRGKGRKVRVSGIALSVDEYSNSGSGFFDDFEFDGPAMRTSSTSSSGQIVLDSLRCPEQHPSRLRQSNAPMELAKKGQLEMVKEEMSGYMSSDSEFDA